MVLNRIEGSSIGISKHPRKYSVGLLDTVSTNFSIQTNIYTVLVMLTLPSC